ncbi:MAG: DEAD/DEAH box helicase [Hyphomicrobiales bacterium]|nr:DEAD/DEAH box helicase [Hyphomicrobiales bacterium]
MTDFSGLGLAEPLLRALREEGYANPTPIQAQSIPALLKGHDLLGIAQTGTGKTAAFALPILNSLIANPRRLTPGATRALILAPTRELAVQIADSFKAYGRFSRMTVGVILGGVAQGPQIKAIARGYDILVATPGRLLDHIDSRRLRLDQTEVVVLDEADHMLDLGFIVPIRRIVGKLPKTRQTLLFSATMPKEIASLAADLLHNPVRVEVTPVATTAERIAQEAFLVEGHRKRDLLVEVLRRPDVGRALIFTRTKRGADRVADHLEAAGFAAGAIHGNKSQNHRQRTLDAFKAGRAPILVATDIAARGIDVDDVSHVVNFDLPEVPETYVHRIGRTARAGREGVAVSLVDNSERSLLRAIEKTTRQMVPTTDRRDPNAPRPAPREDRHPQRPAKPHHASRPRSERAPGERVDARKGPGRPQGEKRPGQGAPGEKRFNNAPRGEQARPAGRPRRQRRPNRAQQG